MYRLSPTPTPLFPSLGKMLRRLFQALEKAPHPALALGLVTLLAGCATPTTQSRGQDFDWGPVASRLHDPSGGTHLKAIGPVYEHAADTNGLTLDAVRPFYSTAAETDEKSVSEFLWPLEFSWDFQNNHGRRVLTSFYTDFDKTNSNSRWRWWCFPFWYQGRDAYGTNYTAFFPLGGEFHEFLFQDEANFVLWPLYLHNRVQDENSYHILWPVYCRENNAKNDRFRIWPFYGWNIKRGESDKRFCLWPFVTWGTYQHPDASGYGYLVLPLWGHMKLENQESWMLLPPLLKYGTSAKQKMGYMPWPVIQWASGDVDKFYFWPVWGYRNYSHIHGGFYLWPLGWWKHLDRAGETVHRYTFAPLWFSESTWRAEKPTVAAPAPQPLPPATNCVTRYWHLWPLCAYERFGTQSRFRTLMLWPMRHSGSMEREYTPFWTLYTHITAGDNADDEFLWGLIRRQRRGTESNRFSLFPLVEWGHDQSGVGTSEWNLLKGLIGYERDGTNTTVRLLWFGHIAL